MQVKATPRFERMLKRLPVDRQKILLERASELESDPYIGKRLAGPLRGLMSLRGERIPDNLLCRADQEYDLACGRGSQK